MITLFFLQIFAAFLGVLFSPIPSVDALPEPVTTVLAQLGPVLTNINLFFPLDTFGTIIAIWIVVESSIAIFRFGNWVFNKLRGAG